MPPAGAGPATTTDALVRAGISEFEIRPEYRIVRTPRKPDFWFGNCIVLEHEPPPADYDRWLAVHAQAFTGCQVERRVVVWETPFAAELPPYSGPIERQRSTVFAARAIRGTDPSEVDIREFSSAGDWASAEALVYADQAAAGPAVAEFAAWRFRVCRADAAAGRCRVWGAFVRGEFAAFAGVYASANHARFITPITAPAFRRRGLFRALSRAVFTDLHRRYPAALCIIVAAAGEAPEHVYSRLGFEPIGRQCALVAPVVVTAGPRFGY